MFRSQVQNVSLPLSPLRIASLNADLRGNANLPTIQAENQKIRPEAAIELTTTITRNQTKGDRERDSTGVKATR
jgi:hypothetical protein